MKKILPFVFALSLVPFVFSQSYEHPIRFSLGFFQAEGLSAEAKSRLRLNIKSAVASKVETCSDYLSFIPEDINQAYIQFNNQDFQYNRDYKVPSGFTAVPEKANYVISMDFRVSVEYGARLTLSVFRRKGKKLEFVAQGVAESSYVLSRLVDQDKLKTFAIEAIERTLTTDRLGKWLELEGVQESNYQLCFTAGKKQAYSFAVSCTSATRVAIDGENVTFKGGSRGYLIMDIVPGTHKITVWDEYGDPILKDYTVRVNEDCLTLSGCSSGIIILKKAKGCPN
jgi:hypothetical protein